MLLLLVLLRRHRWVLHLSLVLGCHHLSLGALAIGEWGIRIVREGRLLLPPDARLLAEARKTWLL